MQTETKSRVRVGRTEMDFFHNGETITAAHPFYGPANSLNLLNQIRNSGYREPTAPELASFVHEYFEGDESQAQEVNRIMKNNYFSGFTGVLYMPKEKVAHFIDYPEFDGDSIVNRDNLIKRISESRAEVPFEHLKPRFVSWKDVSKDPYFIVWAGGSDGAEKLAELASKHPRKEAYIWAPNAFDLKEPTARVACLDSYWDRVRFDINSYGRGDGDGSVAFGVLK